jgi:phosphoribosyl-dephospho-CoA transferase
VCPSNGTTDEAAYWRLIASEFEELARTCLFCNFTAKHRGSLRRHMVKMHNLKQ